MQPVGRPAEITERSVFFSLMHYLHFACSFVNHLLILALYLSTIQREREREINVKWIHTESDSFSSKKFRGFLKSDHETDNNDRVEPSNNIHLLLEKRICDLALFLNKDVNENICHLLMHYCSAAI